VKLCRVRQRKTWRKVGSTLLLQSLNLERQDIFAEGYKLLKVIKFSKLPPPQQIVQISHENISNGILHRSTCTTLSHCAPHNLHCLSSFLPLCLPNFLFRRLVPEPKLKHQSCSCIPNPCQ